MDLFFLSPISFILLWLVFRCKPVWVISSKGTCIKTVNYFGVEEFINKFSSSCLVCTGNKVLPKMFGVLNVEGYNTLRIRYSLGEL